jgi:receptor-type tyrosine-protein phosphatase Q
MFGRNTILFDLFTKMNLFYKIEPGPPVFLAGERVGSAGILLSWNTPLNLDGRIVSYIVKYKEICPWMQTVYTQVRAKPDSLEVLLTNLNPGTTYEIKVTVCK